MKVFFLSIRIRIPVLVPQTGKCDCFNIMSMMDVKSTASSGSKQRFFMTCFFDVSCSFHWTEQRGDRPGWIIIIWTCVQGNGGVCQLVAG